MKTFLITSAAFIFVISQATALGLFYFNKIPSLARALTPLFIVILIILIILLIKGTNKFFVWLNEW